ncbi:MAG: cytochrome c peroxidase [Flavobacteriales bacterium]
MKYAIVFLTTIWAACNEAAPKLPPGADHNAAELDKHRQLREDALAFFQPLPNKVEHPAGPDTPEKVALGKKLFLDPQLSSDGTISCNSCHRLDHIGVDNEVTSTGVRGQKGGRNSPTVFNAALHNMQFWDGRATDVEQQAGMPMMNPVEMAVPSEVSLVQRLKGVAEYVRMFKDAYPADSDPLQFTNIRESIGAFERTLMTPSRFDAFLKDEPSALTTSEMAGLRTFLAVGCTNCHTGAAVGGTMLQKFGVHADFRPLTGSSTADEGRKQVTGAEADKDVFKVPALRNITETAPYFHDGRVTELEKAIRVMGTTQLGKELTDQEVIDLMAFLEALTGVVPTSATATTSTP